MREYIKLMDDVDEILSEPDDEVIQMLEEHDDQTYIFCPKCLSKRLSVRKKGYNVSKATTASILGVRDAWLWGMWDMDNNVCTCQSCGFEFDAKHGCKGTKSQIRDLKQYIESNLKTETDAELGNDAVSKFGVTGLHESYIRRLRDRKGVARNPGFSFVDFLASAIVSAVVSGVISWLFDYYFLITFVIIEVIAVAFILWERHS